MVAACAQATRGRVPTIAGILEPEMKIDSRSNGNAAPEAVMIVVARDFLAVLNKNDAELR